MRQVKRTLEGEVFSILMGRMQLQIVSVLLKCGEGSRKLLKMSQRQQTKGDLLWGKQQAA